MWILAVVIGVIGIFGVIWLISKWQQDSIERDLQAIEDDLVGGLSRSNAVSNANFEAQVHRNEMDRKRKRNEKRPEVYGGTDPPILPEVTFLTAENEITNSSDPDLPAEAPDSSADSGYDSGSSDSGGDCGGGDCGGCDGGGGGD